MAPPKQPRAKGAVLPSWWMNKVREIVDQRKEDDGESLVVLARLLSEAFGRPRPWDHGAVSRFLSEKNVTVDMAEAFTLLFGVPRPQYQPRTFDEALSMQQVARRYDAKMQQITAEQRRRLNTADQVLEAAEDEARDQRDRVDSRDGEGADRGRRTGRASRGRSSTS